MFVIVRKYRIIFGFLVVREFSRCRLRVVICGIGRYIEGY